MAPTPRQVKSWQPALLLLTRRLAHLLLAWLRRRGSADVPRSSAIFLRRVPQQGAAGRSVLAPQAGYRSRTLSVVLDDPIAAARSLRSHMEPADLMELIVILAEAAANVVGKRPTTQ
jgi:hypothetical protein